MRLALFGTGPVGRALAGGLLNRGHSVAAELKTIGGHRAIA
jgi:predicted dinucleotide-binding enzyme